MVKSSVSGSVERKPLTVSKTEFVRDDRLPAILFRASVELGGDLVACALIVKPSSTPNIQDEIEYYENAHLNWKKEFSELTIPEVHFMEVTPEMVPEVQLKGYPEQRYVGKFVVPWIPDLKSIRNIDIEAGNNHGVIFKDIARCKATAEFYLHALEVLVSSSFSSEGINRAVGLDVMDTQNQIVVERLVKEMYVSGTPIEEIHVRSFIEQWLSFGTVFSGNLFEGKINNKTVYLPDTDNATRYSKWYSDDRYSRKEKEQFTDWETSRVYFLLKRNVLLFTYHASSEEQRPKILNEMDELIEEVQNYMLSYMSENGVMHSNTSGETVALLKNIKFSGKLFGIYDSEK